jgi:hypothetical protein
MYLSLPLPLSALIHVKLAANSASQFFIVPVTVDATNGGKALIDNAELTLAANRADRRPACRRLRCGSRLTMPMGRDFVVAMLRIAADGEGALTALSRAALAAGLLLLVRLAYPTSSRARG